VYSLYLFDDLAGCLPAGSKVSSGHHHRGPSSSDGEAGAADTASYDVSVKVGDTIYVVRYTPSLGEGTVKYAAGRDLLVLVGKSTIRYNDILGRSYDVPIETQRPAANSRASKLVSREAQ